MKKLLALILVLAMMLSFVSCAKKADFFEENLEDADYSVNVIDDEDDLEDYTEDYEVKYVVIGTKLLKGEYVMVVCFNKLSDAKDAVEDFEENYEDDDMVIERKGKIVVVATSDDAIDDAYGK